MPRPPHAVGRDDNNQDHGDGRDDGHGGNDANLPDSGGFFASRPLRLCVPALLAVVAAVLLTAAAAQAPGRARPSGDEGQSGLPSSPFGQDRSLSSTSSNEDPDSSANQDDARPQTPWSVDAGQTGSSTLEASVQPAALPAAQILDILDQRPEVVVEVKSLLADRWQQQGAQVQPGDISDEMLYSGISSSSEVRAQITTFLRARGYVSADAVGSPLRSRAEPGAREPAAEDARFGGEAGTNDAAAEANPSLASLLLLQQREQAGGLPGDQASAAAAGINASALSPASTGTDSRAPRSLSAAPAANRDAAVNASTDEPKVLRRTAPYNLRSMRDLYTQLPEEDAPLKRFGSELFLSRSAGSSAIGRGSAARDTPLDVPLGPDYVIGPGDTLTINLWGGVTQSLTRQIDRDGRILLPEAGSIALAGLTLAHVETLIGSKLKQQFRDAEVSVTVSGLRSVRVYVVGDVQRPGGYDVSALATPLSALYAAGGPTAAGSLRILQHFRGRSLVEEIDLYDFLLHGLRGQSARFESGDTLLVPPAGPQIAISGAVKRPAIYEVSLRAAAPGEAGRDRSTSAGSVEAANEEDTNSAASLASIVADAGGFSVTASLSHITVERIDANRGRQTITLDLPGSDLHGSDLHGSDLHPGAAPEGDPSAAARAPAVQTAIAAFKVRDGDRIRIAAIAPYSERAIYLDGHVLRPGRQPYHEGMRLSDVLRSYADMLPEPADRGQIVRLVPPDLHAETIAFRVPDVLIGNSNLDLQPFDTIRILGRYEVDAPRVTIHGEVLHPGSYPLSDGMTAAQLVRMAGGFRNDALLESADLTSYSMNGGRKVSDSLTAVAIGAAVAGSDPSADVPLKRGDILTIHQITGWNDIGQSIRIDGQVAFPGSYGFGEGERLSSVLRRAGGFRETAYPAGAVLVRQQVRDLEEKSREELVRQIETSSAAARLSPNLSAGDSAAALQLIQVQQDQVLAQLKSQPPSGRLVVQISSDIDSWANTPADIEMRRGDVLTIPRRPGFVLVTGQVYNATALSYTPGRTAGWYLSHAGGVTSVADRKRIFIIRANGSVVGRSASEWFHDDVLATRLHAGDVVVVPQKVIGASLFWRNLLATAQVASSIAVTAGVAGLL
ncbi:MAG TPA: SLBB domain-containing protein [Acidisarcina sp.]